MMFLGLKAIFFFDQMHEVLFRTKMQFLSDLTTLHIFSPHQGHSSVNLHTLEEPIHQILEMGHFAGWMES